MSISGGGGAAYFMCTPLAQDSTVNQLFIEYIISYCGNLHRFPKKKITQNNIPTEKKLLSDAHETSNKSKNLVARDQPKNTIQKNKIMTYKSRSDINDIFWD